MAQRGSRLRQAIRFVAAGAAAVVAAVLLLGLAYSELTPVSTLMLARWITLRPVQRIAVPLESVAPSLLLAVVTSEDSRFCLHEGIDWEVLRQVVGEAEDDGPRRGASTIPMQTAKNLFLWPGRSYIRKALELPLALYLDAIWSKRRMMEVYVNIAEWGDGIFGIEAAAQRYFGKSAVMLTRAEAALLAAALPSPIRRNASRPSGRHRALAARLLARMEASPPMARCLRG